MKPKFKSFLELTGIYAVFVIMAIIISYPIVWAVCMSLNSGTSFYSSSIIPKNWSFEHFKWLFTDPNSDYLNWYKNSMIVSGVSAIHTEIITTLVPYGCSSYKFVSRQSGIYTFL